MEGRREEKKMEKVKESSEGIVSTSAEEWVINESEKETFNFLPQEAGGWTEELTEHNFTYQEQRI